MADPSTSREATAVNAAGSGCEYLCKERVFDYQGGEIYPQGICPWLYYSCYPYMLGLLYGADFGYNDAGDGWAMCPAIHGCKVFVRRREHPGVVEDERIGAENHFVIYAEVCEVGECPEGHRVGQKFVFPTCMKEHFMCPAAWYQAFPLLPLDRPSCIDASSIPCPDWMDQVVVDVRR